MNANVVRWTAIAVVLVLAWLVIDAQLFDDHDSADETVRDDAPAPQLLAREPPTEEEGAPDQTPPPSQLQSDDPRVVHRGLLRRTDGTPVAGARVVMKRKEGGSWTTQTDAKGRFSVEVAAGRFDVVVERADGTVLHRRQSPTEIAWTTQYSNARSLTARA